jgi:hypothetical protein
MSSGSPLGRTKAAGPSGEGLKLTGPLSSLPAAQMSVFLYILATRASCAAQRQGFEKKGPV